MKNLLCFISLFFISLFSFANGQDTFPQPSAEMQQQVARLKAKGLPLIDYHIHIRGGMTADKAFDWEKKSGIISGVLENHGRDWPLSDNEKLAAFIKDARRFPLLVGIQVNDRDWFKTITPELRKQLDYILADTMVMNNKDGKPQKLWLENEYTIDNPDEWLERYYQHCLTVVNEPITILANPTWLPPRMEKFYDKIWTPERMERFIDAAIKNNAALEIQSPSEYPKPDFIKLAVKKGAKLSIGRNNHTDKPDELKRSLTVLEELEIKPENMLVLKGRDTLSPQNSKLNPITNPALEELRKNFAAPHRDYSTGPLWTWNDRLTEEQVRSTLRDLAGQHVKQVWVHPRPGLMTPYLSDEWFAMWKAALDEAQKLDMNVWIYDENSYPSGFAGGLVPDAMPESRGTGLQFAAVEKLDTITDDIRYIFAPDGKNITAATKEAGVLAQSPAGTKYLVAKIWQTPVGGWYGGKWYVDLLKKGVTEKFLDITLEAYANVPEIKKEFGKRVLGIFTDEPHPAGSVSGFALGGSGIVWNDEIPEAFEKKFGYSLIDALPSLVTKTAGDWKKVRHNYQQIVLDLFIENWAKPYFERSEKYGLQLTGHYWEHGWPGTSHGPDNMAMYAWHQRPAIDLLMNTYNDSSPNAQFGNVRSVKELASVANQMGHSRTLSENYGAGGWDLRFEDIKRLGDWSYALGVNTNNEHLSYVTIKGARKRDHPQSFSYHANWFEGYHVLEDYFTRLSYVLSQGRQVNHVLVIEPTTTAWMYQGDPKLNKIGQSFTDFVNVLERAHVEYDLASEDIIKRFGKVDLSRLLRSPLRNGRGTRITGSTPTYFSINQAHYYTVILPPHTENLDAKTVELLSEYTKNNGNLIIVGDLPNRIDGVETDLTRRFRYSQCTPDEAVASAKRNTAGTGLSIETEPGTKGVFHHRRHLPDCEVLFICNSNQDQSAVVEVKTTEKLFAESPFQVWDLMTGIRAEGGSPSKITLPPSGSILLVRPFVVGAKVARKGAETQITRESVKGSETKIRRLEDNVLTLDYVDVKVAAEEKKDIYTWQANRWIFQKHGFGNGNPWDSQVQFKDELITRKFHTDSGFEAVYHFTLQESVPQNLSIVIERPELYTVYCNGKEIKHNGWWLDRAFGKFDLSKVAAVGENAVKIAATPMTIEHELEPAYLLGDFSLQNAGKGFAVVPPKPLKLQTGDAAEVRHNEELEGVSWLSAGVDFRADKPELIDRMPSLEFTFDKEYPVAAVRIWNYNEQNLKQRGVKSVTISNAGNVDLPIGNGLPYDVPTVVRGRRMNIKTMTFKILSNHNGVTYPVAEDAKPAGNGFVGLAEIQFLYENEKKELVPIKNVTVKASSELVVDSHNRKAKYLVDGSGLGTDIQGWNKQGMPFYSGKVEYSRTFNVTKVDTKQKYSVKLPANWNGTTAQVTVNGKSAGFVISAPWDIDVTELLQDGENTVAVIIYGAPKNLLGPHHAGTLRGSAWPSTFHRSPEHQPRGEAYDTIGYGLFEPFELITK